MRSLGTSGLEEASQEEKVMWCLVKAYFMNICKLSSNGSYIPVNLLSETGSNEGNINVELDADCVLRMTQQVGAPERAERRRTIGCSSRTFTSRTRSISGTLYR